MTNSTVIIKSTDRLTSELHLLHALLDISHTAQTAHIISIVFIGQVIVLGILVNPLRGWTTVVVPVPVGTVAAGVTVIATVVREKQ